MAITPHVLVVCQDPGRFERVAAILRRGGFQASPSSPGSPLLEALLLGEFDTVLLDAAVDSIWETLRTLRQLRSVGRIPLAVYAGGLPRAEALLVQNRASQLGVITFFDPDMTGEILLEGLRIKLIHHLFAVFA